MNPPPSATTYPAYPPPAAPTPTPLTATPTRTGAPKQPAALRRHWPRRAGKWAQGHARQASRRTAAWARALGGNGSSPLSVPASLAEAEGVDNDDDVEVDEEERNNLSRTNSGSVWTVGS